MEGASPASFEFFAGRAPSLYEYCGRYTMRPHEDDCEFENPANFSEERVAALVASYKSEGVRAGCSDEEAKAWVLDPRNWQLRIITPLPNGYNEELYQRLASL